MPQINDGLEKTLAVLDLLPGAEATDTAPALIPLRSKYWAEFFTSQVGSRMTVNPPTLNDGEGIVQKAFESATFNFKQAGRMVGTATNSQEFLSDITKIAGDTATIQGVCEISPGTAGLLANQFGDTYKTAADLREGIQEMMESTKTLAQVDPAAFADVVPDQFLDTTPDLYDPTDSYGHLKVSPQQRSALEAVDDIMRKQAQEQQRIDLGCGKNPGNDTSSTSTPRLILGKEQNPDIPVDIMKDPRFELWYKKKKRLNELNGTNPGLDSGANNILDQPPGSGKPPMAFVNSISCTIGTNFMLKEFLGFSRLQLGAPVVDISLIVIQLVSSYKCGETTFQLLENTKEERAVLLDRVRKKFSAIKILIAENLK